MLKPKVPLEEFEKYGFRRCKGFTHADSYYLCVSRGVKMIFVSPEIYTINSWDKNDPRIHQVPNCRYRDKRDALDITYQLIKDDMLECSLL